MKHLYYSKMAKEMNVTCDFLEHPDLCITREYHGCAPESKNQIRRAYV